MVKCYLVVAPSGMLQECVIELRQKCLQKASELQYSVLMHSDESQIFRSLDDGLPDFAMFVIGMTLWPLNQTNQTELHRHLPGFRRSSTNQTAS
jgi:hypothetical protein